MYCGKCGEKLDEITGLCPKCNGRYKSKRKKICLIALILVLAVTVLITGGCADKKHGNDSVEKAVETTEQATIEFTEVETANVKKETPSADNYPKDTCFIKTEQKVWTYRDGTDQANATGMLRIAVDEKILDIEMCGYSQKTCCSLNGNVWCVLSGDDNLFVLAGETVAEIAQNVNDCVLSVSGDGLAYTDERDTLILYSVVTGEKTEVAQNVDKSNGFVISPDGKTVAYTVSNGSDSSTLYVYSDGKEAQMGENRIPIGISNEGNQIYYVVAPEGNLYAPNSLYVGDMQGASRLLAESQVMLDGIRFNFDQTELLFASDGNYYLSINGGAAVQLTSDGFPQMSLDMVTPRSSMGCNTWNNFMGAIVYPVRNLSEHYYTEYPTSRLLYLDKEMRITELGEGKEAGCVRLSEDAGMLMYSLRTENGYDLYRAKTTEISAPERLAQDISYGLPSSNWNAVYYLDQNDTLWYKKEQENPKQIAQNVEFFNMTYDGYALFGTFGHTYSDNNCGTLYSSKDGGEKQILFTDFLDCLYVYPTVTLVYTNYDKERRTQDIYAAVDGVDFAKIVEGAKYEEYY